VNNQSQPNPFNKAPVAVGVGTELNTGIFLKSFFVIILPANNGSKQK
jgi:hypothetical protein